MKTIVISAVNSELVAVDADGRVLQPVDHDTEGWIAPDIEHDVITPGPWRRLGMYGSTVYVDGYLHTFTVANDRNMNWVLVGTHSKDGHAWSEPKVVMDDCQCAAIWRTGEEFTGVFCLHESKYVVGRTFDPYQWTDLHDYHHGMDVCSGLEGLTLIKTPHWDDTGQDRVWLANKRPTNGLDPVYDQPGVPELETYAMGAVLKNGWYIGLQSAFFVSELGTEKGYIEPVLAISRDGVVWHHPYGYDTAIPRSRDGVILMHSSPVVIPAGSPASDSGQEEVHWYGWESNYQHGEYASHPSPIATIFRARWLATDFERMVANTVAMVDGSHPVDDTDDFPVDDWPGLAKFAALPETTARHYTSRVEIVDGEPNWWRALYLWRKEGEQVIVDAATARVWRMSDVDSDQYRTMADSLRGDPVKPRQVVAIPGVRIAPGHVAPALSADGVLECVVGSVPHVSVGPQSKDMPGMCLELDRTYYVKVKVRITTPEWVDGWGWFLQFWGPGYSQHTPKHPPFAVDPRGRVQVYGATEPVDAERFPIDGSVGKDQRLWDSDDDWHDFVVEYRPSQTHGECRVWRDGRLVFEYEGVNTIHPTQGPIPFIGLYAGNKTTVAAVDVADAEIRMVV